jgi:hypothetical protein
MLYRAHEEQILMVLCNDDYNNAGSYNAANTCSATITHAPSDSAEVVDVNVVISASALLLVRSAMHIHGDVDISFGFCIDTRRDVRHFLSFALLDPDLHGDDGEMVPLDEK